MSKPEHSNATTVGSESREEILRTAAELFMEFGFSATSIDAVAERLGSTKGRIYYHYRSKADLFFDVQVSAMNRLASEVEPIARSASSPLERLSLMAVRHMQILVTELPMQKVAVQGLERQLLGTSVAAKRLRAVVKMRDDYEALFTEVIDEGIRANLFMDLPPKLIIKPFFGALNWTTVWFSQRRLQSAEAIQDIVQTIAAFAIRGLLKDPKDDAVYEAPFLRDLLG